MPGECIQANAANLYKATVQRIPVPRLALCLVHFRPSIASLSNALTTVSDDDLQKYKVPMRWRDRCVAYFALYQTCLRRQSANSSVNCHHDKHVWEECEIMDLNRRKQELEELKEKMRLEA